LAHILIARNNCLPSFTGFRLLEPVSIVPTPRTIFFIGFISVFNGSNWILLDLSAQRIFNAYCKVLYRVFLGFIELSWPFFWFAPSYFFTYWAYL